MASEYDEMVQELLAGKTISIPWHPGFKVNSLRMAYRRATLASNKDRMELGLPVNSPTLVVDEELSDKDERYFIVKPYDQAKVRKIPFTIIS